MACSMIICSSVKVKVVVSVKKNNLKVCILQVHHLLATNMPVLLIKSQFTLYVC